MGRPHTDAVFAHVSSFRDLTLGYVEEVALSR
jgi:hypothetical protein